MFTDLAITVHRGVPAQRSWTISNADGTPRDLAGLVPWLALLAVDGVTPLTEEVQGTVSGSTAQFTIPGLVSVAPGNYITRLTLRDGSGDVAPDGEWKGSLVVDGGGALASLESLKGLLFGSDADAASAADDALLFNLLVRSSAWVESQVGYPLLAASYTHLFDGNGGQALVLRAPNVTSVTSVKVDGSDVAPRSLTLDGWVVSGDCLHLAPALGQRATALAFSRGIQNVEVSYTAGFVTPPEDIVGVVTELAAMAYRRKDVLNLMTRSVAGEYIQYQTNSLPVHIKSVLDSYRVTRVG